MERERFFPPTDSWVIHRQLGKQNDLHCREDWAVHAAKIVSKHLWVLRPDSYTSSWVFTGLIQYVKCPPLLVRSAWICLHVTNSRVEYRLNPAFCSWTQEKHSPFQLQHPLGIQSYCHLDFACFCLLSCITGFISSNAKIVIPAPKSSFFFG